VPLRCLAGTASCAPAPLPLPSRPLLLLQARGPLPVLHLLQAASRQLTPADVPQGYTPAAAASATRQSTTAKHAHAWLTSRAPHCKACSCLPLLLLLLLLHSAQASLSLPQAAASPTATAAKEEGIQVRAATAQATTAWTYCSGSTPHAHRPAAAGLHVVRRCKGILGRPCLATPPAGRLLPVQLAGPHPSHRHHCERAAGARSRCCPAGHQQPAAAAGWAVDAAAAPVAISTPAPADQLREEDNLGAPATAPTRAHAPAAAAAPARAHGPAAAAPAGAHAPTLAPAGAHAPTPAPAHAPAGAPAAAPAHAPAATRAHAVAPAAADVGASSSSSRYAAAAADADAAGAAEVTASHQSCDDQPPPGNRQPPAAWRRLPTLCLLRAGRDVQHMRLRRFGHALVQVGVGQEGVGSMACVHASMPPSPPAHGKHPTTPRAPQWQQQTSACPGWHVSTGWACLPRSAAAWKPPPLPPWAALGSSQSADIAEVVANVQRPGHSHPTSAGCPLPCSAVKAAPSNLEQCCKELDQSKPLPSCCKPPGGCSPP
jgi:hypothetical protein